MSKRKAPKTNSGPAASAGDAPEMTVVDGNAVGVAPSGAVATTDDDAIEAALAAIEADNNAPPTIALGDVEDVTINVDTTEDGADVTITAHVANDATVTDEDVKDVIENDADAILADLEAGDAAADTTTTATDKPKRAKKDATATPAAPKRDFHTIAAIDKPTLTANLDGCNAVKVIEKAQNLIQSVEVGKKLSRYTSVAIKCLVADGKITGKSLVEAFEGEGLSLGTARAQAQQMTALFQIAGIAAKDATAPKELVLADRGLADELVKLAA